jgi:hypothetical protein
MGIEREKCFSNKSLKSVKTGGAKIRFKLVGTNLSKNIANFTLFSLMESERERGRG